jgi:catechol 2,3-dioxygenase-like lactoylglutathione lyase family enzyme
MEEGVRDGQKWGTIKSGDALMCIYEEADLELENEGIGHWGFRITDEKAWLDTVKEHGIEVKYGGVVPYDHSKSWYVFDPSGYEIEVAKWNNNTPRFS